jgi:hypothetical protein
MTDMPEKSLLWPIILLALGTLLTGFTLVTLLVPASDVARVIGLALSPWGPICLIIGALIARHAAKVNRLVRTGIPAEATVTSIDSTGSVVNGRPVLRIGMSVPVPGQQPHIGSIRNAPPYHLVSMLRLGASIPVMVDPADPSRFLIDWKQAERSGSGF